MLLIKKNKSRTIQIFILFILIYITIAYSIVNYQTIGEQLGLVKEGSSFFAQAATYRVLNLSRIDLGFDKDTYEIELIIFNEINDVRDEVDLDKLKWDPLLAELAREHALDMAQNNYFNHTNLDGLSPTQRAEELGIKTTIETNTTIYTGIGENLGFMPKGIVKDVGVLIRTKDIASAMVYEWMLSEPHKENILTDDYQFTGVGVAYDGKGNYYIAQEFQ